jgi:hypothetical protein
LALHGFLTVIGTVAIAIAALWPLPSRRLAELRVTSA